MLTVGFKKLISQAYPEPSPTSKRVFRKYI